MKNLTTPQAILFGFGLVTLAIASIPYSSQVVTPSLVSSHGIHKFAICDELGQTCADIHGNGINKYLHITNIGN